jgi:AcrR family transcriptional regulator
MRSSVVVVDMRTRILTAAAELLDRSGDADISTRAVCEAAGVAAPALYRHFGDKDGLLAAVVDYGFDQYLAAKRAAPPSADPVEDIRQGWDTHVGFALAHPMVYRLMYSPGLPAMPAAAAEAFSILEGHLEACAAAGRLRVSPAVAAQMIMSANIGLALNLLTQPAMYADPDLSSRVRDAVHAAVLTSPPPAPPADAATTASVAAQLWAQLRQEPPRSLTPAETGLLHQWLSTLADAPPAG